MSGKGGCEFTIDLRVAEPGEDKTGMSAEEAVAAIKGAPEGQPFCLGLVFHPEEGETVDLDDVADRVLESLSQILPDAVITREKEPSDG